MIKSNKKQKECFISCSEEKIKAGLCSCNIINSFKKLKAIKLDKNDPKVIKTLENSKKAIEECQKRAENNFRFPFWK